MTHTMKATSLQTFYILSPTCLIVWKSTPSNEYLITLLCEDNLALYLVSLPDCFITRFQWAGSQVMKQYVTRYGKTYIFAQKFEIALLVATVRKCVMCALRWRKPRVRSPFLPRVINGSVVAPSYVLFLNNAHSSSCAFTGNRPPYTTARNNDVIQRGLDVWRVSLVTRNCW